jgi:hypothetical protein
MSKSITELDKLRRLDPGVEVKATRKNQRVVPSDTEGLTIHTGKHCYNVLMHARVQSQARCCDTQSPE